MNVVAGYGAGTLAVLKRDAAIFVSYRARFFTQILSVVITLTMFYYISRLVTIETFESPDHYYAFVVVGLVIFQVITSTLGMLPIALRQELVAGTLETMILSPFGTVAGVISMTVFPFLRAVVLGIVMLVFATIVYTLPLEWSTAPLAIPVAGLAALAFMPFSLLFSAAVLAFKQAPGAGYVVAGLSLIAGLYFPVELLPNWIEWMSGVQPFTPAVDLLRNLLVGTPLKGSAGVEVAKMAGFAVVLLPISAYVLAAALRFGQRRGTIIEY